MQIRKLIREMSIANPLRANSSDPRRTPQARHGCRTNQRGQVHGQATRSAVPGDDFGRDNIKGLKDGLGDAVGNLVAEVTYETSAPTIDSELVKLKFSGANIFVNFVSAKFAAQAIKKAAEIGWKPVHICTETRNRSARS